LSARRLTGWKWLVVGLFVIFLTLFALPALLTVHWVGSADLKVQFLVTDEATGLPVPNATIEIQSEGGFYDERHPKDFNLVTGPDGCVSYTCCNSMCFGTSGLFTDSYAVHLPWWQFRVSATGYGTTELVSLDILEYRRLAKRDGPGQAKLVVPVMLNNKPARPPGK
jgi:hypothetical protein